MSERHFSSFCWVVFALSLSILVNIDGMIAIFRPGQFNVGSFNPLVCSVITLSFFLILVFYKSKLTGVNYRKMFISSALMVIFFLIAIACNLQGGNYVKLLRDVLYILFYFISLLTIRVLVERSNGFRTAFIPTVCFINILVFPMVSSFLKVETLYDRFGSFQISSALFGITIAMLIVLSLFTRSKLAFVLALVGFVLLILSGTRVGLMLLGVFYFWAIFSNVGMRKPTLLFFFFAGISAMLALFLYDGFDWLRSQRILQIEDISHGSLNTRIYWYGLMVDQIAENNYFGGLGAGASEQRIGYISHFDMLRFWVDYSILSVGVLILFLIWSAKLVSEKIQDVFLFFVILTFLGFHNFFQAPAIIFVTLITLVSVTNRRLFF